MSDAGNRRNIFQEIYDNHLWGGGSRSGPGSDIHNIGDYCKIVNEYLEKFNANGARTIVEIGCGDWCTTSRLDVSRYQAYVGIDIVPEIIKNNTERYSNKIIGFSCIDAVSNEFPSADVIIIKDVLQHLSANSINNLLENVFKRCKYALITNDIKKERNRKLFHVINRWEDIVDRGILNSDINDGESRPLSLGDLFTAVKPRQAHRYYTFMKKTGFVERYTKEILVYII